MRPANERRTQPRLVNCLVLALLMASAVLLPPPIGPSAPTPALAATAGEIYIVDQLCCGGGGGVLRVDPITGVQTIVASGTNIVSPFGIAIAANGDLLVVDEACCGGGGGVLRVNPITGVQTIISSGINFVDPTGIAIGANRDLFVADPDCCTGPGGVIRVNPITSAQTVVSSGVNFDNPLGIAIAANGDLLVVDASCCGVGTGGVIRVNPVTSAQTIVASGTNLVDPFGIAIAANGDLLVADVSCCGGGGGVVRVNPTSGAQTIIASGTNFIDPIGIAIAPNGDLFVVDSTCCGGTLGGVIRVDPISGAQTIVSSGSNFINPRGIAIAPVLSIGNSSVTEGQSGTVNLTFTLSLAPYTSQTVSVQVATADGTAQAGSDYTSASGTVTFNPGETTRTIAVLVTGDTTVEPDETVLVNLANPSGANLAQAQATGTIQNDDVVLTACGPRPTVGVAVTSAGAGRLQASISPSTAPATPGNRLLQLRATIPTNARIDIANGPADLAGEQVLPVGDGTQPVIFFVRRIAPGAVTVPLVAVDTCGEWQTFVGGGSTAF